MKTRRHPLICTLAPGCIGPLFTGCSDKAEPAFKDCERLKQEAKLEEALSACKEATSADPNSESGMAAVTLMGEIEKTIQAEKQADANAEQAVILWDGRGKPKDQPAARKTFEETCEQGSQLGCAGLGGSYVSGVDGTGKDYEKALPLLATACEADVPRACAELGIMYSKALGVTKDLQKAGKLLRGACDAGDPLGCTHVGFFYLRGRGGVPKDPKQGLAALQKGCDADLPLACSVVAAMYYQGDGVEKSLETAERFSKKACELGDGDGCFQWALVLKGGDGVERDLKRSAEVARKACDLGSSSGCGLLAAAYGAGEGVPRDQTKALPLYEKACQADHALGCYGLAMFHKHGWGGLSGSRITADELMKKACDLGHPSACKEMGK